MSLFVIIKFNYVGEGTCRNWNDLIVLIKVVVRNVIIDSIRMI